MAGDLLFQNQADMLLQLFKNRVPSNGDVLRLVDVLEVEQLFNLPFRHAAYSQRILFRSILPWGTTGPLDAKMMLWMLLKEETTREDIIKFCQLINDPDFPMAHIHSVIIRFPPSLEFIPDEIIEAFEKYWPYRDCKLLFEEDSKEVYGELIPTVKFTKSGAISLKNMIINHPGTRIDFQLLMDENTTKAIIEALYTSDHTVVDVPYYQWRWSNDLFWSHWRALTNAINELRQINEATRQLPPKDEKSKQEIIQRKKAAIKGVRRYLPLEIQEDIPALKELAALHLEKEKKIVDSKPVLYLKNALPQEMKDYLKTEWQVDPIDVGKKRRLDTEEPSFSPKKPKY